MNFLIVDDKPNLVRVTAMALRTLDCASFGANTTAGARQVLAAEKIDAVLLDVNLGGESGLDFLSQLVTQSKIPVVICTSHAKDEIAADALGRGAFDCLMKPFTMDDLRRLVDKIAQHRRLTGQNSSSAP